MKVECDECLFGGGRRATAAGGAIPRTRRWRDSARPCPAG
jgi:hypothetical protein